MKTMVMSIGRFQGMSLGHEKLMMQLIKIASWYGVNPVVFVTKTQDNKANPLSPEFKISILSQLFPSIDFQILEKTSIQLLQKLVDDEYDNVILIIGSDRFANFQNIIDKYVGIGKKFPISNMQIILSGERHDGNCVANASGTKMRQLAIDGNLHEFTMNFPSQNELLAERVFTEIRKNTSNL